MSLLLKSCDISASLRYRPNTELRTVRA
jgi:hypothetical protein